MSRRPNILLVMADQMRQDAIGGSGCGTPMLDSLAGNGMLYTGCITTSPVCAPARASMLLGRYPSEIGVLDNSPHIVAEDAPNWVRALRDGGYHTALFGKSHYYAYNGAYPDMRLMEGYLASLGYEAADEIPGPRVCGRLLSHMTALWQEEGLIEAYREDMASRYGRNQAVVRPSIIPFGLYQDVYPARRAAEYLSSYSSADPFFVFLSFPGPHDPWDCPREYRERYPRCQVEAPLGPMKDASISRPRGLFDEPLRYDVPTAHDIEEIRMDYSAHVRLIDDMVASVVRVIEEKGMLDDTVIIFTSDHGEMLGDFGRLYKENFLRSSVSIPLIISGNGIKHGTDGRLCMLMDVGATIMDIAGIGYSDGGVSLLGSGMRDIIFSEYRDEIMASDGKSKLAVNGKGEPYQLFDLASDPCETMNLAGTGCPEERRLLAEIDNHRRICSGKA